jgi:hypothetical protein
VIFIGVLIQIGLAQPTTGGFTLDALVTQDLTWRNRCGVPFRNLAIHRLSLT